MHRGTQVRDVKTPSPGSWARALPALGLCAFLAMAYLGRFATPSGPPATATALGAAFPDAAAPAPEASGGLDRAIRVTFVQRFRTAIAWLDKSTTRQGAYFWPSEGPSCGLRRR